MNDTGKPLPPDELGHRLTEVFDLVGPLYRLTQRKVEQGESVEGLSVTVRAVLDLLHKRGPLTVPAMGRALAVSRQFVQRTVNEAAAQGLVESIPNPAHQRSSLIRLTDPGREAITAVQTARDVEMVFYLYVVDERRHLVGVVSLRRLLLVSPDTPLSVATVPSAFSR